MTSVHPASVQNAPLEKGQASAPHTHYTQDSNQSRAPYYNSPSTAHSQADMANQVATALSNFNLSGHGHNHNQQHQRRPFNPPFMLLPNMVGGMPQMAPHIPSPEQGQSLPFYPHGIYPGFVAPPHLMQGSIPGMHWQYPMNGDGNDQNVMRRASYPVSDENSACAPSVDQAGQGEYYPAMAPFERSPFMNYLYNPQIPQSYMQFQPMKGANGYILQDLDALLKQDPPIPRAVPAMWTNPNDLTLAKCLENREGITNVYIRGFPPETTDEMLHAYTSRFGKIDRCKAIVDLDTGLCKGFGFVQFFGFDACENCIRGFFHLGYQASFAQKSRNSRLKDLEDRSSTNIYCTNVPIDWTEADLRRHFEPYTVVSEKISRDEKTGVSKEVGFARFESREIAVKVLSEFHNVTASDGTKLLLRFADTKAQKQLKQQSNERRAYRAGEYNFSVALVNGGTPSPSVNNQQPSHFSPSSQASLHSPTAHAPWTPATSISPPGQTLNKRTDDARHSGSWNSRNDNQETTISIRQRPGNQARPSPTEGTSNTTVKTVFPIASAGLAKSEQSSPRKNKENIRRGSVSPLPSKMDENTLLTTPRSTT